MSGLTVSRQALSEDRDVEGAGIGCRGAITRGDQNNFFPDFVCNGNRRTMYSFALNAKAIGKIVSVQISDLTRQTVARLT